VQRKHVVNFSPLLLFPLREIALCEFTGAIPFYKYPINLLLSEIHGVMIRNEVDNRRLPFNPI